MILLQQLSLLELLLLLVLQLSAPSEGVFGAGAHSDYGMLTLLATDEVPGLQVSHGGLKSIKTCDIL
jgi:isopenicillin N synthase-like dioxygenase